MPHKIRVNREHKLIHVILSGKMSIDVALQLTTDAARLANKHGFKRILFDIRKFETHPTITQIFDMAATAEKRGLKREYKRATVISKEAQSQDFHFFEDVSVNRGYNVASFTDIDKAIEWLTTG